MDITSDNDSYPMSGPVPETETVAPHMHDKPHATEPTRAGQRLALSLQIRCELARILAYESERREAKIRELQDSIKNDTYHITAEQIADKMLRSILRHDPT
jgi:anti-sigma28 factor (negative regulator of flagellin synthesis)